MKKIDPKTGKIQKKKFPFMRYFKVWNRDQCTDLPEQKVEEVSEFDRHNRAEEVITDTGAEIHFGKSSAFYAPSEDVINLPDRESFTDEGSFYATSFHELGHWTGHESRLNREIKNGFGSKNYAFEELVAELTSAFLCAETGIDGELQHPEYIGEWIKKLENDKTMIFKASGLAKKATDYIWGKSKSDNNLT